VLVLLLLVPLAAAGYVALERRRRARLAGLGSMGLVTNPVRAGGGARRRRFRRWLPVGLVLAGLASLVVALARPQAVVGIPRQEGTVLLAFDVSGSMAANDMSPTRMEAAKAAASAFVEQQPPGIVIGVVAFSDSGLSVQVPTSDQAAVLAAIGRLHPERGTSLSDGINASLDAIANSEEGDAVNGYYTNRSPAPEPQGTPVPVGSHGSAVIVLLSDGEDTADRDPLAGARAAADAGIRVDTVGVGSANGATLEVEGFSVHTQLDEETLKRIADMTGGTYQRAEDADQLRQVYDSLQTRLTIRAEPTEVTALAAGLGLGLLMLGGIAGLVWLGRLP
jgi:Ca-activated chloride channel family protein